MAAPFVVHDDEPRPGEAHECTDKCRPHVCKPLATASIRKIHFCLSGALARAVRWRWITVNPLDAAEAPRGVSHNPHPPSAEQAAAILTAAFAADLGWGVLVWLAMTTGARRGELCALRWDGVDLDRAVLSIRTSIAQEGAAPPSSEEQQLSDHVRPGDRLKVLLTRRRVDVSGVERNPDSDTQRAALAETLTDALADGGEVDAEVWWRRRGR